MTVILFRPTVSHRQVNRRAVVGGLGILAAAVAALADLPGLVRVTVNVVGSIAGRITDLPGAVTFSATFVLVWGLVAGAGIRELRDESDRPVHDIR